MLQARGITGAQLETMLHDNPGRLLTMARAEH
jgi:predicted metal-dependent phosphotriesterase family hydrolase